MAMALRGIGGAAHENLKADPEKIKGSKKAKDKTLQNIGIDMMIRIASLLPEGRQGPYFKNKKIKKYQSENGFIPNP